MRHIIAATDFSEVAGRAVVTAGRLARAFDASLTLAHAYSSAPIGPPVDYPLMLSAPKREELKGAVSKLLAEERDKLLPGMEVDLELMDHPSTWAALSDLAERRGADLLVLGTHGRTALPRLLLGSVAESTLRHAPCSVLTVRGEPKEEGLFPKILVATDFSPASRPALETAAKLQVALDAQVTLLHVYVVVTPLWGERQRELSVIDADLRGALEERHAKMFERPFEVALMESDNAALAITDYAADHGFDLIVTSTHGRTGLKRALLGSVAENTVRHAPCPVWTARA